MKTFVCLAFALVFFAVAGCGHAKSASDSDGGVDLRAAKDLPVIVDLVGVDLSGADLTDATPGEDLAIADLGADLGNVDLVGAPPADLTDVPTPDLPPGSALVASANSITNVAGAGRSDPEGVAPTSPSVETITWHDSRDATRAMTLYGYLYQYDFSSYDGKTATTRSATDDAYGHPGFGFVVSHNTATGNSPLGKANAPTVVTTTVFAGGHHALHHIELTYDRDKEGGGDDIQIPVVIEWLAATGRDHPIWAVTWRMGAVVNPHTEDFTNTYRMDVRGPYGSLNFDGATKSTGDAIGGVAWGDFQYRFSTPATAGVDMTMQSAWTYNTPNTVDFDRAWTKTTNSEMGIVQTRAGDKTMGYQDYVDGRQQAKTSTTYSGNCLPDDSRTYTMPCVNGWPYQMMEFDWDPTGGKSLTANTGTKLMAWGSPYGWLGSTGFDNFDYSAKVDGTGDRSYAMFIVLGPKCHYGATDCDQPGDVMNAVAAVEALSAATITNVTQGSVATTAPRGPGATQTKTLTHGYDDAYAAYALTSAAGKSSFTFTPASGKPVAKPIFIIRGYPSATVPSITVGGMARTINTGAATSNAFVSYRASTQELWVTLNQTFSAATAITISP